MQPIFERSSEIRISEHNTKQFDYFLSLHYSRPLLRDSKSLYFRDAAILRDIISKTISKIWSMQVLLVLNSNEKVIY